MTTQHDAEARLSRAIDKENAALAALASAATNRAEYGDWLDGLCAAAKKWTNAYHELSRAQKGLRAVRRED